MTCPPNNYKMKYEQFLYSGKCMLGNFLNKIIQ